MAEDSSEEQRFGGTTTTKDSWRMWLAHLVSEITNPLFIAPIIFLIISFFSAPDIWHAFLWWIITAGGISLAPLIFIYRGVQQGRYTDHHVSKREQRLVPLLFGTGCVCIVFLLLTLLHASHALLTTLLALIVVSCVSFLITRFWKVSFHLIGIAGAITVLVLLFGPPLLILTPLVVLVGWARWQVRAHTVLQACIGAGLAIGGTVGMFWLLGH